MFCLRPRGHGCRHQQDTPSTIQHVQKILWRVGCWLEVPTKVFTIFSEGLAYFSTCITHKCESTTKTYSKYYVSTKFRRQLYCCVLTLDVSIYICFFLSLRRGPKSMIEAARANFELNINNYCKLSVGTRMKRIAKIIGCYWTITGRVISAWLVISSWQWTQCPGRGAECETVAVWQQLQTVSPPRIHSTGGGCMPTNTLPPDTAPPQQQPAAPNELFPPL